MNCAVDIRKSLCTSVVLSDSVVMFQGIGEQTPSYDDDVCFSNCERRSQVCRKASPS